MRRTVYCAAPRAGTNERRVVAGACTNACARTPCLRQDVANQVILPPPEDDMTALCGYCEDLVATVECLFCDTPYCDACNERFHNRDGRREHERVKLVVCAECEFQAASHKCLDCGDGFCYTCHSSVHSRGRLQDHGYQYIAVMCAECQVKPAKGSCAECDGSDMQWLMQADAKELSEKLIKRAVKAGELSSYQFVEEMRPKVRAAHSGSIWVCLLYHGVHLRACRGTAAAGCLLVSHAPC